MARALARGPRLQPIGGRCHEADSDISSSSRFPFDVAPACAGAGLASQLVGVWNLNSQVRKEVATGATSNSYGEKPIGRFIFTRGGHAAFTIVGTDRKAPASPNLTDAERIELFKTMSFGSGTYKVEGNKIVTRYDTSWHQLWTGKDISAQPEINGKTLTLTTEPFKAAADGKEIVVVTTWERLE